MAAACFDILLFLFLRCCVCHCISAFYWQRAYRNQYQLFFVCLSSCICMGVYIVIQVWRNDLWQFVNPLLRAQSKPVGRSHALIFGIPCNCVWVRQGTCLSRRHINLGFYCVCVKVSSIAMQSKTSLRGDFWGESVLSHGPCGLLTNLWGLSLITWSSWSLSGTDVR